MSYSHFTDAELVRHLYALGGLNPLETELLSRLETAVDTLLALNVELEEYEQTEAEVAAQIPPECIADDETMFGG